MDDVGQTLLNWASAFGTLEMVGWLKSFPILLLFNKKNSISSFKKLTKTDEHCVIKVIVILFVRMEAFNPLQPGLDYLYPLKISETL